MFTAEQAEGAAGIDVEGVLYAMAFPFAPVEEHAVPRDRVRLAAAGRGEQGVVVVGLLGEGAFDLPVIGKAVFQGGEGGLDLHVTPAPVGGRVERTAEIGLGVVRKVVGVAGPGRAARLDVLVVHAEGEQGVGGEVGLDDAVEHVVFLRGVIAVRVGILIHRHQAPAHATVFIQRPGNIAFGAVVVPRARAGGDRGLELAGRFFADQVDRGRGLAGAREQAGGALDDIDAVIEGHVDLGCAFIEYPVIQGVDAVVLEVGNGIAAGGILHAFAVVGLGGHPGSIAQHIANALGGLIVHQLAGYYGDGLRGFAKRQRQFGRAVAGAGGIGMGVFGGQRVALALTGNVGRAQLQAFALGRVQNHCIAIELPGNAAALQQGLQRLDRFQRTADRTRLDALYLIRAVEDLQVGLLAQFIQRTGQRLRRDVQGHWRRLGNGGGQQHRGHQGDRKRGSAQVGLLHRVPRLRSRKSLFC